MNVRREGLAAQCLSLPTVPRFVINLLAASIVPPWCVRHLLSGHGPCSTLKLLRLHEDGHPLLGARQLDGVI